LLNVISGLLSGAGAPASTTSYESIATITVGSGGSSSISFSSIPSTFKHLQVRYTARTNRANALDAIDLKFNSDTSQGNYVRHELDGNGSGVSASAGYPQAGNYPFWISYVAGNNAGSNVFGAGVIDIFDYQNTNKYKTSRLLGGYDNNGSGYANLFGHLYMVTTAISSIQLTSSLGSGFQQYSSFALYGIKG
jgi:hypothetical protein